MYIHDVTAHRVITIGQSESGTFLPPSGHTQ